MSEFAAEILGTMVLMLLGNGVVANVALDKTKGNNGGWIVITAGWGFAVFAGVLIAQDFSGAHLNPAVTIGLATAGKFAWSKVGSFILAQCIGAAIGTSLVWLVYKDHYDATTNPDDIRGSFCNTPAIPNNILNFITEAVGTFVLVFAVFYMTGPNFVTDGELPGLGSVGALPVAIIVFAIGLSLGGPTGYAINPARDLVPRIMHQILPIPHKGDSGWSYSWIPVLGPIAGAVVAALLSGML